MRIAREQLHHSVSSSTRCNGLYDVDKPEDRLDILLLFVMRWRQPMTPSD